MKRLLLLAAASFVVAAGVPTANAQSRKATARTSIGVVDAESAARSALNQAVRAQQSAQQGSSGNPNSPKAGGGYTLTQIDLPPLITGTGFTERIQVMTPFGYDPFGADVPLLLVGNGFGLSAFSFFNGMSDIPNEANNRGWLICAVTQLDDKSFGAWNKPQSNVAAALHHMVGNYRVDVDRIYAIGWSMSGGSLASYAARHLDPAKPMIAAIVIDAGTLDLVDTYYAETPGVQTILENPVLFQGPPSGAAFHFNYERTETILTDVSSGALDTSFSQARNLLHIPVFHVYSLDDDIPYLPLQNQLLDGFLSSIGADLTTQTFTGLPDPHSWDLINPAAALNWCQQYTLDRFPATFDIDADRNDIYYWSTLTQRTSGQYSRIAVDADLANDALTVTEVSNLSAVRLAPPVSALDLRERTTLTVENQDVATLDLTLIGPGLVKPTYVLIGTQIFDAWTFDALGLHLTVPAAATSVFTIAFDEYTGELTAPATVNIGSFMPLSLHATTPSKPYLLLISTFVFPTPLDFIDPGDSRYVLAGVNASTVLLPSSFGPSGIANFNVFIPSNPQFIGVELAMQFVTYPGFTTIIDEISNLARCRIQ